tara:strand:- start:775 stop:1626 length:852 start_codon:yes stop_codon:yes gene_type:complete
MYGDTLGKMAGSYFGAGSQGAAFSSFLGNSYDIADSYYQNKKDQAKSDAAQRLQAQLAQQQMNLALQDASDAKDIQGRILDRSAQLDKELQQTRAKLGPRVGVNAGDLYNNYNTFKSQIMGDYNDTVDRISSQGFADAISRGMDRSTQYDASQQKLARVAAAEMPKLNQAAYDQALSTSTNYADALNYGRDASFKEVNDLYTSVVDMEARAMPLNAQAALSNAASSANTFATNTYNNAADTYSYMGNALGNFDEKVAPNTAYALLGKGNFVEGKSAVEDKDNE